MSRDNTTLKCLYCAFTYTELLYSKLQSIRILANWSLNPNIGAEISEDTNLSEILNCILQGENVSGELLLCAISTLNNISFYKDYSTLDEINIKTADCKA